MQGVDWVALAGTAIVAGGAGAWGFAKLFGEKWIEDRFASRLELLKARVSQTLDRTTTLNQREFEALPEAWAKVHMAFAHVHDLLSRIRARPNLDQYTEVMMEEQLENSPLSEWEKVVLRQLPTGQRTAFYHERSVHHEHYVASDKIAEAVGFLYQHGILIRPEIFERLEDFIRFVEKALIDFKRIRDGDQPLSDNPSETFRQEGMERRKVLEQFLRDHYWSANALHLEDLSRS